MVAVLICLAGLLFTSCSYGFNDVFWRANNVTSRTENGTLYELSPEEQIPPIDDSIYTVAVYSDIHFGKTGYDRHEQDFLDWLLDLQEKGQTPRFCICLGDIADHGYRSEFQNYNEFTTKIEKITGTKVYNTLGNHDLYNDGWKHYKELIFPYKSFYHFNTSNFSWYFLDNASCSLGSKQFKELESKLKQDKAPKIIATHIPVYGDPFYFFCYFAMQNSDESDELLTLFAEQNVKLLIDGHEHLYYKTSFGNYIEYTVPSILVQNSWTLLTINENDGTIEQELIKK